MTVSDGRKSATGRLRIVRKSGYSDRLRKYRIAANGRTVGQISANSTLDIELPCGEAILEARIDWCRSEPLKVRIDHSQPVVVEVANNKGAILALWSVTFGSGSYLLLRKQ